jgi:hypothetical protein
VAATVAGDRAGLAIGVGGGIIVEVGEFLLETPKAFVLLSPLGYLIARQRAEKSGVIIGRNRLSRLTSATRFAHHEPQQTTNNGQKNDAHRPHRLRERAHAGTVSEQHVYQRVNPKRYGSHSKYNYDPRHGLSLGRTF